MVQIGTYLAKSAAAIVAFFVVFFGFAAILVVLGSVQWSEVWDWSGKIAIIAAILWGVNAVISLMVGLMPHKTDKK